MSVGFWIRPCCRFWTPSLAGPLPATICAVWLRRLSALTWSSVVPDGRKLVLCLVPPQKQAELEARVGRSVRGDQANDWTETQVRRLREFFGLVEERVARPGRLQR